MKYYLVTDTHFGHHALRKYCGRPDNADDILMNNIASTITRKHILIHLGDFCIGHDRSWHREFFRRIRPLKAWLVRGNHDRKSTTWYLNHGWDYVGESIYLNRHSVNIAMSHEPLNNNGYDLNIHGHSHNTNHHDYNLTHKDRHLIFMEHHYQPIRLNKIIKNHLKHRSITGEGG